MKLRQKIFGFVAVGDGMGVEMPEAKASPKPNSRAKNVR